jgi:hypothetical protein
MDKCQAMHTDLLVVWEELYLLLLEVPLLVLGLA